ncbi:hypothetical protein PHMEG_00017705 [Phytophthora megakarya]|uniref:PX domain-containing protein n=1 Tax=Phytophthora megakarya TaxID=4795 RepID=A0A225VVX0_9STRA|nr:hypothetical protein PHMEG_00017705 [Phytophthora megakarya]
MIDEDSISVVITASKEVHSDTVDSDDGAKAHSKGHKYTMYTVFVRNVTTGGKCVVRRRYSDFYKLRKELMELVSWGHCGFCAQYLQQISEYPFPRRRLLRSSRTAVVKERMDSLGLFLRHMLLCIMARSFEDCTQACENIENCILKSFLQMEQTETLFPTMASKQRPIDILQALEEKRQQQIKAAGLRTKSLAYTTLSDQSDQSRLSRNQRQVGADTCHLCLQKWTHCYCNSDQDSVYPVHVPASSFESPAPERPSVSMADSDASRCSRCENDWNHCYCCQVLSPTASSWQDVRAGLFSSDPYAQQRVVSRVAAWRSRAQLPVAIDATAQLVELQLHEAMAQNHHHAVGVSSRSHMELSLLYATVIVRCVNGLVDGSQKGAYALAVSVLAQRIGIPLWVVDLRHESTHNQLPSLPVLRFAARHLLAWLRANYWGAQEELIRGQVHHVTQWLFDQFSHLNNKMQDNQALKPVLNADTLRNIVVPLLVAGEQYHELCEYPLDDDMLMPDGTSFVTGNDDEEDNNADAEDTDKAMDAIMEDLDAAYDTALQHNLELHIMIARDGLRQGGSTTVLPKQELQRIQEEIEIW